MLRRHGSTPRHAPRPSWFRLSPEAKHMAVRLLDREFVGPAEVLRRGPNLRALSFEFGEEGICVVYADPEPGAGLTLLALTQHDPLVIARH
jgi:hypothetical protein